MTDMSDTHLPGWYDDGSGVQRWWDGNQWTVLVAAAPPPLVERRKHSGFAIAAIPISLLALLTAPAAVDSWFPLVLFIVSLGFTITGWVDYRKITHVALWFASVFTALAGLFILIFATGTV